MFCEACEEELAAGTIDCPKCGKKTPWGREARLEPYLKAGFLAAGAIMLVVMCVLITHNPALIHHS